MPDRSEAVNSPTSSIGINGRAIGTSSDGWETDCRFGVVLEHKANAERGRDYDAFCNAWNCRSCRPFIVNRYVRHLLDLFSGLDIYLAENEDHRWDTTRKQIQRVSGEYARIPAPNESSLVLSTALGELVTDHSSILQYALDNKPNDSRRVTTSRRWQGGWKPESYWNRLGISNLSQYKRISIYEEENCSPIHVDSEQTDLTLPPQRQL